MESSSISDPRNAFILALVTLLAMVFVVPLVDKLVLPLLLEHHRLYIARRRLRAPRNDLEAAVANEGSPARDFAQATRLSTSEPSPGSGVTDYELPQIPPLAHFDSIFKTTPPQAMPVAHLPRAIISVDAGKVAFANSAAALVQAPSTSRAYALDNVPARTPPAQASYGAPAGYASSTPPQGHHPFR